MFDAPMGYHQLAVDKASQEKLAFQGVDAIKWTYTVMPFGPTNGPATFINFIYDVDSIWKELAKSLGITIDNDNNTRIIVDDIVSWADNFQRSLMYMRCQLIVCRAYRLSLNLGKATSSHVLSNSLVSMSAPRAIARQSQNISCSRRGQPQSWSEMWLNFLALYNFIHILFLTSKFVLKLCAQSQSKNTLRTLGHIGHRKLKQHGRT
jgi:hypothetical protein